MPAVATAYLNRDATTLQTYSDPDRLPADASRQPVSVAGLVRPCGVWGNGKLAFVSMIGSYDGETKIGHTRLLLVFRKPSGQWQLLVAARDPISNERFVNDVPSIAARLAKDDGTGAAPLPATLLSPAHGEFPIPARGQRFGDFRWWSSTTDDVVAEIVEFSYRDDARLILSRPARAGSLSRVSAGMLWTTNGDWNWRVWSISRSGDVAFSDARLFQH